MESTQCKDIDVIRMILLVVGVIMTECYYATPGIMFIKYYKQKLPEKYLPTIQILTNFLNTINWTISGAKVEKLDVQKIICNSIGASFIWRYMEFWELSFVREMIKKH